MPKSIARNLTFPEKVTKFNLKKMEQLVKNGTDIYPGNSLFTFSTQPSYPSPVVILLTVSRCIVLTTHMFQHFAGAKYLNKKGGNTFRLDIIPDKSDLALDYGWRLTSRCVLCMSLRVVFCAYVSICVRSCVFICVWVAL